MISITAGRLKETSKFKGLVLRPLSARELMASFFGTDLAYMVMAVFKVR